MSVETCWYEALTLDERLALLRGKEVPFKAEVSARLLARWRDKAHLESDDTYRQWLHRRGVDERAVLMALTASSDTLQTLSSEDASTMDWLDALLEAWRTPASASWDEWTLDSSSTTIAFVELMRPSLDSQAEALLARLHILCVEDGPFSPRQVVMWLLKPVVGNLAFYIHRSMIFELHAARDRGVVQGETPQERFAQFIERLKNADFQCTLLLSYPVLARQCTLALQHWLSASHEFMTRMAADLDDIRAVFGNGYDVGRLVGLDVKGDSHKERRHVIIARFEFGLSVVYKPRSLSLDRHFQELVTWMNERGQDPRLPTLRVLDRGDYGWMEFVASFGCANDGEVERFYRRHGAWIALLYRLAAVDVHAENLIAAGEAPVIVDVEALFHPRRNEASDADGLARELWDDSVLSIGLLPGTFAEEEDLDISAIGATRGQRGWYEVPSVRASPTDDLRITRARQIVPDLDSQTSIGGRPILPGVWRHAIERGYLDACALLDSNLNGLRSCIDAFSDDTTRVLIRNTARYATLLSESWHPDLLGSGLARDLLLDDLWAETSDDPGLIDFIGSEQRQLWNGDIPYFSTTVRDTRVCGADGTAVMQPALRSGMGVARSRLARIEAGNVDHERQLWFLRGSLASLAMRQKSDLPYLADEAVGVPGTLDDIAGAVARRVEEAAIRRGATASWLVLDHAGAGSASLNFDVVGADLYGGLAGVILFLGYAGQANEDASTASNLEELARAALETLHRRRMPDTLSAFEGYAGLIYLWTRLAMLWNDATLLDRAEAAVADLVPRVESDTCLDIISGSAGCILCMLALHRARPSSGALELAVRCADHLTSRAMSTDIGIGWDGMEIQRGFSHGASGIAFALLELSVASGEARFRHLALDALRWEDHLLSNTRWTDRNMEGDRCQATWCHGAPGIALSRLAAVRCGDEASLDMAHRALDETAARSPLTNHCLCHGSIGNLEPFLLARQVLPHETFWQDQLHARRAILQRELNEKGWRTSLPGSLETVGLMCGLSGIGYGLLRLSRPSEVPSILMLE